jgi:ParB family chromosome partitioning protein
LLRVVGHGRVPIDDIVVRERWRQPSPRQIESIRDSIRENGLLAAIGVRLVVDKLSTGEVIQPARVLVYGATRLAAAKLEGWAEIDAQILEGSDVDFEKAELAENLHRGELTKLQRDRQIARYIELCGRGGILRGPRAKSKCGRPEGGTRAVARELDIPESTARDAVRAGKLAEPAVTVITELGLADNPAVYRAVAAEPTADAQIAKAHELANRRAKRPSSSARNDHGPRLAALMTAWTKAGEAVQGEFLIRIGHAACRPRGLTVSAASSASSKGNRAPIEAQQLEMAWVRRNGPGGAIE